MPEEKPRVLIVEDEASLLLAIEQKLKRAGFLTVPIQDGREALSYLRTTRQAPRLIWLDYYLPSMNGLEFLGEVKKDPNLKNIPVFVVTNTAGPDKVSAMMALGADRYFLKAERRLSEIIDHAKSILSEEGKHA